MEAESTHENASTAAPSTAGLFQPALGELNGVQYESSANPLLRTAKRGSSFGTGRHQRATLRKELSHIHGFEALSREVEDHVKSIKTSAADKKYNDGWLPVVREGRRPHALVERRLSNIQEGAAMTRKKIQHVNLIPKNLKQDLAERELQEIKRGKVFSKWNSATIFTLLWAFYVLALLGELFLTPAFSGSEDDALGKGFDIERCPYGLTFLILRAVLLVPSSILAYCWRHSWWSSELPDPEIVGIVFCAYIALMMTLACSTPINITCGRHMTISAQVTEVFLTASADATGGLAGMEFELAGGVCTTNKGITCIPSVIVDRRSYFEQSLFEWSVQLVLVLFAFTSLFKASKNATIIYTFVMAFIATVGMAWQGFGFWLDSERVFDSGVYPVMFFLLAAAVINIYSATVMHDLELRLIESRHEIDDANRLKAPDGPNVVYLRVEFDGAAQLASEVPPAAFGSAINQALALSYDLKKQFFGTELSREDELTELLESGVSIDPVTQKRLVRNTAIARIQTLMREIKEKKPEDGFIFAFHDVFDALSFALTLQNEMMDLPLPPGLAESPCGRAREETVSLSPSEKDSRARAKLIGTFGEAKEKDVLELLSFKGLRCKMGAHMQTQTGLQGSAVRFTEQLCRQAEGGMILVSQPVAERLAGALEQLSNSAGREDLVARLVHMGVMRWTEGAVVGITSSDNQISDASLPTTRQSSLEVDGNDGQDGVVLELWHIFNEPMFGRHLFWGDRNLKLKGAEQVSMGFYDSPVIREGRPEFACVCFGNVDDARALQAEDPEAFGASCRVILDVMRRLLVAWRGYNVPQREGHFMQVFAAPADAVNYHEALQSELLTAAWPPTYRAQAHTGPCFDDYNALPTEAATAMIGARLRAYLKEKGGQRAIDLFKEMDKDGSGKVEVDEFVAALERMGIEKVSEKTAKAVMKTVDANRDGALEYKEILSMLKEPRKVAKGEGAEPSGLPPEPNHPPSSGRGGSLLYNGLVVSVGMSAGPISKALERARANYLGPTCNRAARVGALARHGQLLMCAEEFALDQFADLRAGCDPKRRAGASPGPLHSAVVLAGATLKGIKGVHDVVRLETGLLATRRAAVPRAGRVLPAAKNTVTVRYHVRPKHEAAGAGTSTDAPPGSAVRSGVVQRVRGLSFFSRIAAGSRSRTAAGSRSRSRTASGSRSRAAGGSSYPTAAPTTARLAAAAAGVRSTVADANEDRSSDEDNELAVTGKMAVALRGSSLGRGSSQERSRGRSQGRGPNLSRERRRGPSSPGRVPSPGGSLSMRARHNSTARPTSGGLSNGNGSSGSSGNSNSIGGGTEGVATLADSLRRLGVGSLKLASVDRHLKAHRYLAQPLASAATPAPAKFAHGRDAAAGGVATGAASAAKPAASASARRSPAPGAQTTLLASLTTEQAPQVIAAAGLSRVQAQRLLAQVRRSRETTPPPPAKTTTKTATKRAQSPGPTPRWQVGRSAAAEAAPATAAARGRVCSSVGRTTPSRRKASPPPLVSRHSFSQDRPPAAPRVQPPLSAGLSFRKATVLTPSPALGPPSNIPASSPFAETGQGWPLGSPNLLMRKGLGAAI